MADGKAGTAGFLALVIGLVLVLAAAAQEEPAPSLEFRPDTEVVPELRQKQRSQPQTLFARKVGGFGISRGSFDGPVDVVHDNDRNYYVLDAGNNRVQKFDDNGRYLLEWGSLGSRDGQFKDPTTIVRDSEGRIVVSDTGNHRIQVFTPEGEFLASYGRFGTTPGKANRPTDIAFDDDGNVFVVDSGNERIQKFSVRGSGAGSPPDIEFEEEWGRFEGGRLGDFENVVSIAFDDDRLGRLFLLGKGEEEGTCQVQILEINAARREVENTWVADYPEREEEPCDPVRVRIDNKDDYVYILDGTNGVLRRYTKAGRYLDSVWEVKETLNEPRGMSIEPVRREIYIADTGNNIVQIFTLR
jgi:DNA-binding beta-propeller fold protein YncE